MEHTHITPEQIEESKVLLDKISTNEAAIENSAHKTQILEEKLQGLIGAAA